ncbi:MAG: S41 family peptidase [Sphingobacteriales bacterium]|nr:S41 family peptidase [Sphingobacteriales bacterium]
MGIKIYSQKQKSRMKYPLIILFVLSMQALFSQETTLDEAYKKDVIEKLSVLMQDFYIYPDIAKKTSEHLDNQYKAGYFDTCKDNQRFAAILTEVVQSVNKDKHMRIMSNQPYIAPKNTLEAKAEHRRGQINNYRSINHGFKELKMLEGNVAYLDLRMFAPMDRAKEIADAYMKLMSLADAVIIDLTKNGGGDPSMVQYLCSYFFAQKLHLNSLYYREGDRTEEFWTLEEVGGKKLIDIPLFVMIGEETFSGAEEFSYNMQTQRRATLIGQTSAGAANPGGTRGINDQLSVFIPTGRAINPITNTSWEGIGVQPEIITKKEETFDQALKEAQKAADLLRRNKLETYIQLQRKLNQSLENFKKGESENEISSCIKNLVDSQLFGEWDINNLGYEYMTKLNKPEIGLCILKSNTIHFPESPNVYDSYGEALKITGDLKASLKSYQKAVDIAIKNNDENLTYYKEALQKIKNEINADK